MNHVFFPYDDRPSGDLGQTAGHRFGPGIFLSKPRAISRLNLVHRILTAAPFGATKIVLQKKLPGPC